MNNMTKQVLCIRDYIDNGKELWTEGNYYELLEIYEDKSDDDYMYHIKTNDGYGYVFGDDFNVYFQIINDDIKFTLKTLKQMKPLVDELKIRCVAIMKWKDKNDPEELIWKRSYINYGISDEGFCFEEDCVSFQIHETWAYGGSEFHSYTIPFTEIVSDDWHTDFIEQVNQMKIQKEIKQIEQEKLVKEQQEYREFAEYERLKKKFENGEDD